MNLRCKLSLILVFFLLSFSRISYADSITVDLVQNPNWSSAYGQGNLIYQSAGPSFMGSLSVSGMTPNSAYQVKLEGQPNDDPTGNINLGSIGRWWVVDETKPWGGFGATDENYDDYIDAGYTVLGYILFDSIVTDSVGSGTLDFYLDYSWHTIGVTERGEVTMPFGEYTATFLLTENFPNWHTPLLKTDIAFEVTAPVPEPTTMLLLGSGLMGIVAATRRRRSKK